MDQAAVLGQPPIASDGPADPNVAVGLDPSPPSALTHTGLLCRLPVGQPVSTLGFGNHQFHTMPGVCGCLGADASRWYPWPKRY